jgi:cyanosortase A-associated protein
MNIWKNIRLSFLAVTLLGVILVLAKSILIPAQGKHIASAFVFPSTVPLTGWQPLSSNLLVTPNPKHLNYLSGRQYQYIQNDLQLNIEMRYVVNTVGDVKEFIKQNTNIPLSKVTLRQQAGIGFYNLFTTQGKAYLSSCINPRGGTTVTDRQFKQNRNTYDVQLNRLLPWLLGQENLKDNRCLWTHLSVPLKHTTSDHAYQKLETTFFSWYQWWEPRFPKY